MAHLEFDLNGAHQVYVLEKKCTTLGRGSEMDVQFGGDPEISRRHCSIVEKEDCYFLRDDCSTNGTYINDQVIDSEKVILLKEDDEIRIGKTFLTFHK